jgi:GNAT superfamily N-acetyltransferase
MSVESFLAEYLMTTEPVFVPEEGETPPFPYHRFHRRVVELDIEPKDDAGPDIAPYIHLYFIGTLERGKGHGTRALNWLCELADRHAVTLTGQADASVKDVPFVRQTQRLDNKQLRAWYERHGFTFTMGVGGAPTKCFFFRNPQPLDRAVNGRAVPTEQEL